MIAARVDVAERVDDESRLGRDHVGDRAIVATRHLLQLLPRDRRDAAGRLRRRRDRPVLVDRDDLLAVDERELDARDLRRVDLEVLVIPHEPRRCRLDRVVAERDPGKRELAVGAGDDLADRVAAGVVQDHGRARERVQERILDHTGHDRIDRGMRDSSGADREHDRGSHTRGPEHEAEPDVNATLLQLRQCRINGHQGRPAPTATPPVARARHARRLHPGSVVPSD